MRCSMGLVRSFPAQFLAIGLVVFGATASAAAGEKRYGPGVSDREIRIGQTMPYSGPGSAWSAEGLAELAYVKMINDQGGVNGRRIRLISLDDAYSPPKTVEQTRKLIEQEQVALIFSSLGTAPNTATEKYLNDRKVPQLFLSTGASKWADPEHFPWTMGWAPNYQTEGRIYAHYIREQRPDGKIAVLYQNDDYGKDYLQGLKDGLGDKYAAMVVAVATYEVSDPTIDSQVVTLQASGADIFVDISGPKFAAQAIRKVHDIGRQPLHFLNSVGSAVGSVLQPAGLEKSVGIITARYYKDPSDPQWQKDPAFQEWLAWMQRYNPEGALSDYYNVLGYNIAMTMVQVLKQCGDDLTRENILRQATNIERLELPMLLPGVTINTSPSDYRPIKQMRLVRFDGKSWTPFGELLGEQM